jgi:conjugative transfer signal peptidase TraF
MSGGSLPGGELSIARIARRSDLARTNKWSLVMTFRVQTRVPLYVLAAAALGSAFVVLTWRHWGPEIVVNPTRSEPMGFYRIVPHDASDYRRGMHVVFPVPERLRKLVYGRQWLRQGVPFLKTIAALPGDQVCVDDKHFEINGSPIGPIYSVDRMGAALPKIRGCFVIPAGYFFPASTYSPRSFDGRYMGAQPLAVVVGEARALWIF